MDSVLVIEIFDNDKIRKFLKISESQYVDIITDYYSIDQNIEQIGTSAFTIKMKFLKKSDNITLTFRWFESGVDESSSEDVLSSQNNIIYSSNIKLKEKWKIKISIEVEESNNANSESIYYQEEKYFQHNKKAKITCSAFDGLPKARVYVNGLHSNRFKDTAYDERLNTWIGFIMLHVGDHNSNISCHVSDTDEVKSIQIKVNHPTTLLMLEPEFNGYVKNGSKIKCVPFDGYPPPIIKWDFVSVKNHSNPKSLYEIKTDELTISPDANIGTQMEFNCTSLYTNPYNTELSILKKTFQFEIGETMSNTDYFVTNTVSSNFNFTSSTKINEKLNKAAIGAAVAGIVIMIIAVTIVVMLCRSKPKPNNSSTHRQEGSPKYAGSLLAGSKSALHNQMKSQNGASSTFIPNDTTVSSDQNEFNYDDMPRGRRPIKVVDEPVVYSTIVGTMQPKVRPSLDLGPIDRV